jgi:hypothetical protein
MENNRYLNEKETSELTKFRVFYFACIELR